MSNLYPYGRAGSWQADPMTSEPIAYEGLPITTTELTLAKPGAETIAIPILTVMEWTDDTKQFVQPATYASTGKIAGVLAAEVPSDNKTITKVPVMVAGKFNRNMLVWDGSFDTKAKCYSKFAASAPGLLLDEPQAPVDAPQALAL